MSYASHLLNDLQFNSENFPSVIENDGSIKTLDEAITFVRSNVDTLKEELSHTGALLLRGFPVTNADEYDALFCSFGYPNFTYKESLSNAVRINFTEYVFTANEAPKHVEIYLHNEMAQTPIFPNIISLFCETAAEEGGATSLCRTDKLYNAIASSHPDEVAKLEAHGIKYTTTMPAEDAPDSAQGRGWKSTLSVETVSDAEAKLKELGYSWRWNEDGSLLAQTAALPGVKTVEDGRKVFFNQLIAAYKGWKGVKENPSGSLCYGDDSAMTADFLKAMADKAEEILYPLQWQDSDVAIVDNHLAQHGRKPFSGDRPRKVLVALGL